MRNNKVQENQSLASRAALRDATSLSLRPPLARVRCGAEPTAFIYLRGGQGTAFSAGGQ